jgi:large subunit ribosomal protein L5
MPGLKERYKGEIVTQVIEKLGIKNVSQTPKVSKIVVNMGMGLIDKKESASHVDELTAITGQKPVITKASKSIANFKLREGNQVGAKVTLRGNQMYEFLDRLINAALPRIRDFRGISPKGFDGRGNYSLGLKDQSIFPEIDSNNVVRNQGMDVTIVTSTSSDHEARELLRLMGMPFSDK